MSATWGILPAAGFGSRIKPLAFSKELLPVGSRVDGGVERPRAVCEYLLERFAVAGVDRIGCVIAPGKSDILEYLGGNYRGVPVVYTVQARPAGLCDALFRVLPLVADDDEVVVGLPDTIWFPVGGLAGLPRGVLSFLLFPVERPEFFDAVVCDPDGRVREIEVKAARPKSSWVWGGFRMPGRVFRELHALWSEPGRGDEYVGTLVNAWLAQGGSAVALRTGAAYVDVGTFDGYRHAVRLLGERAAGAGAEVLP